MSTAATRPSMALGVALVGAGVLVTSPVTAPPDIRVAMPTVRVDSPNVRLASSPVDDYRFIFGSAIENAATVLGTPGPGLVSVVQHVLQSQPATRQEITQALQTAVPAVLEQVTSTTPPELRHALVAIQNHDYAGAVNTLLGIPVAVLRPALMINPALASVVVGLLGPVISGISATVEAVEDVGDAQQGGPGQQSVALVRAPAIIADGILNGGYGPNFNPDPQSPTVVLAGGLFSPGSSAPGRVVLPGPIATLRGNGPNPADFATVPVDSHSAISSRGVTQTTLMTKKVTNRPVRNALNRAVADVRSTLTKLGDNPNKNRDQAGTTPKVGKHRKYL
jgi:hypothetical protein